MGKVPEPETKRDFNLIKDYKAKSKNGWKFSLSELGLKYARKVDGKTVPLSNTRIYQILRKHGIKTKRVIDRKSQFVDTV